MFPGFVGEAVLRVVGEADAPFSAPAVGEVAVLQLLYRLRAADPGCDPAKPVLEGSSLPRWKMPSTPKDRRGIESCYP
jgi:hypothetical protein